MKDSHKNTHSLFEAELFSTRRQWAVFICVCVLVFALHLYQEYVQYRIYTAPTHTQELYAQVIAQYTKSKQNNGKNSVYEVLKLKTSDGEVFYTTSKEDIKDISHRFVRIYGKRLECSFAQYLKSCFFISYRISLLSEYDYRQGVRKWIDSQHQESLVADLYKTLFMADFLPHIWRDISNKLGVAHLIAISGFHLGILSFVIGGLLSLVYNSFHRFVSYRNKYFDIGLLVLVCLFGYLIVLDFSPSFLRSFIMAVCGFFVVYSGIRLISFKLLFVVVCVCLALFPRLIFSIGFALSVSGVFFIYLFVRHIHWVGGLWHKIVSVPISFNTLIFLDMLPFVHWFFPYFTPLNVLSIPLSLIFVVFFPLMLVAHIFGFGWVCDEFFLWIKDKQINAITFYTPLWFICGYGILCIWAIYSKRAYYALHCMSVAFFAYLIVQFYKSGLSLW